MFRSFAAGAMLVIAVFAVVFGGVRAATPPPWQRFYNSYVSFLLPPEWECKLEGTEWVCRVVGGGATDAIIILTAKEVGPMDGFDQYEKHLRTPQELKVKGAPPQLSTILSVGWETYGERTWLLGVHDNSEVQNYRTRYYATIDKAVAILLTISYRQSSAGKYQGMADQVASSMRLML